jgi:hypothetical protein
MHLKSLLSLCSILIIGCASIPDEFACRKRSATTGFCTRMISDEDKIVDDVNLLDGQTWLDLENEAIILPVNSWKEIKAYILKKCAKNKDCQKKVGEWSDKVK